MKLNASTQNTISFDTAFPPVGQWDRGVAKRSSFAVLPLELPAARHSSIQDDDLARKQEIICAIILSLCLLFTVAVCLAQLARL